MLSFYWFKEPVNGRNRLAMMAVYCESRRCFRMIKRWIGLLTAVMLLCGCLAAPAYAYESTTLHNGMRGEEVRRLQQALIDLGFLSGNADGIFGVKTENAVRKFQRKKGLTADGLAGLKTQEVLYSGVSSSSSSSSSAQPASSGSSSETTASSSSASGGLFGGNYATMRPGDEGDRVRILQQALIDLKYLSGKADGKFGSMTTNAVLDFQSGNKLSADGLPGKKTLKALEKAVASGAVKTASPASAASEEILSRAKISAPDGSSVSLLHWYNDVKPALKSRQTLLVYEPSTGLSWKLQVLSRGRHCDCEPLTLEDTQVMVHAFGDKNTWNPKGVYVQLPSGVWTVASTHDMPHMTGSIKDNGFDGHLCVHFLRDMDECLEMDPNYGVSNQKVIREMWYNLTGISLES